METHDRHLRYNFHCNFPSFFSKENPFRYLLDQFRAISERSFFKKNTLFLWEANLISFIIFSFWSCTLGLCGSLPKIFFLSAIAPIFVLHFGEEKKAEKGTLIDLICAAWESPAGPKAQQLFSLLHFSDSQEVFPSLTFFCFPGQLVLLWSSWIT